MAAVGYLPWERGGAEGIFFPLYLSAGYLLELLSPETDAPQAPPLARLGGTQERVAAVQPCS